MPRRTFSAENQPACHDTPDKTVLEIMRPAGDFGDATHGVEGVISGIGVSLEEAGEIFEHLLRVRAGAVGGELVPGK
jgi:hypothetical protein